MIFHVYTEWRLPGAMDPEVRADLLERDRTHVAGWTRWVAAGGSADFSLIDADTHDDLQRLLGNRPLAPYARTTVTAVVKA